MSDLPPLVADGGELRLARKVAAYVYGRREVTWPDDMENPEDSLPDEREFGWVAKLNGPEPGLSERRFVRGDVKIDAVEQLSNVEQVLDDAATRAGGDVFFESMIEGRGLGRLKPGTDFDEGDLVDVRFWGKILPDQLVTSVEWHDGKPSVKIGGQLTSDTGELARARAETIRLIRSERQEREDDVSEVRSAASSAQSTANTARDEVAAVRDTLAGEQSGEPDLLAQLVAINDELQRLGSEQQPSLMLAFVELSTKLWEAQREINALQEEINLAHGEALENAERDRRQIHALIADVQKAQTEKIPRMAMDGDGFWSRVGSTLVAEGDWVGTVSTFGAQPVENKASGVGSGSISYVDTQPAYQTLPVPQADGNRRYPDADVAFFVEAPGVQRQVERSTGAFDAPRNVLVEIDGLSFEADSRARSGYASLVVWLDAADRGTRYALQVQRNGLTVESFVTTTVGPLGPLGNGHRSIELTVGDFSFSPGDKISFHYLSSGEQASQRRVRSARMFASWIEEVTNGD